LLTNKEPQPLPLKIPTYRNKDENEFSYEKFLIENIGVAIRLTFILGKETNGRETKFQGIIKSVHKDSFGQNILVLNSLEKNGGDQLITFSTIVSLESIPIYHENVEGFDDDDQNTRYQGYQRPASRIPDTRYQTRYQNTRENSNQLSVRYGISTNNPEQKVTANLSYLTKGLMWAPSYILRQDQKQKVITLQGNACLLCDLPFLNGSVIDSVALVAGNPKMECQNVCDPLASSVTAANFMNQLDQSGFGQDNRKKTTFDPRRPPTRSNLCSMPAPRVYDDKIESAEGITAGENMDDFYFYKLKNVPLQGSRPISLPFIEESTPQQYKDVYFFDLTNKGTYVRGQTDNEGTLIQATHAITFKNISEKPFTTGPVSILLMQNTIQNDNDVEADGTIETKKCIKENNFLVQGLMKRTLPNRTATVEITKALDVEGKYVVETSKKRKAEATKKVNDTDYELVSTQVTGTFTVTNMKNEDVKCKVDHLLCGHLEKSVPNYIEVIEAQSESPTIMNPTTRYVWEIQAPAKGKAELIINYCVKQWILKNLGNPRLIESDFAAQ